MAIVPVVIGTAANDGTGDPLRTAFGKLNTSIGELAVSNSMAAITNPDAIKTFRHKAMARLAGENVTLRVGIVGDSQWGYRELAATPLALALRKLYGNAGPGWASAAAAIPGPDESNNTTAVKGEATWTQTGTWPYINDGNSPDLRLTYSSAVGASKTLTYTGADNIASLELFYGMGASASSFRYKFGAGAWTVFNTPATVPSNEATLLIPTPAGQWTFTMEVTQVEGCSCSGAILRTALPGVIVHNFGNFGSSAKHWATTFGTTGLTAAWTRVGFDVIIFSLGGNDEIIPRTPDQYAADMTTLIAAARAVSPDIDIAVLVRPQTTRAAGVVERMDAYAAKLRALAPSLDIALFDARRRFGTNFGEYGTSGTRRQLFQADATHLNLAGGKLFASGAYNLLTG